MVKVIMRGCSGRMGQIITGICAEDSDIEIVAGVDLKDRGNLPYPFFENIKDCNIDADCIIDFSGTGNIEDLFDFVEAKKMPLVLCTTGLDEKMLARVKELSKVAPILRSANMSLGINLIMKLLKTASSVLAPSGFDIEVVEKHHRNKLDAPSGTALALADSINEEFNNEYEYVYDRSDRRMVRPDKEIGFSSVRGGSIVGDHDVIFAGNDEVITISHSAYSRAVFGKGAVAAAKFLAGKAPGMYDMSNVIEASL